MNLMKSIAKYLLSVVLLAVFGTAAGVVAVCYGDEFYWVALRVARWFGPAGLGLVAGVSGGLAILVNSSHRRRVPVGRCDMGHDCEAGFTDVDGRFWCSTYHRDQQAAIDQEMRLTGALGMPALMPKAEESVEVREARWQQLGVETDGHGNPVSRQVPNAPFAPPIIVREPGAVMTGLDVGAVPEELRIPFDPVFDDGPTVINNPAPRPRRETQQLVTLAHQRALGKDPE